MLSFNTDPLVAPISPEELRVLKKRRASGEFGKQSFWPFFSLAIIGIVVFFIAAVGSAIGVVQGVLSTANGAGGGLPGEAMPFVVFFIVCVGFIVVIGLMMYAMLRSRRSNEWAYLVRFAEVNRMRFQLVSPKPQYPGLIFDKGSDRKAVDHLYSSDGVLADVGSYQYTTGSGKNSQTHRWNFVAFRLPQRVPHLLLDAKINNRQSWGIDLTNLPDSFESSQRISLGAPFDEYYEVYAPNSYGVDAFYLLPPNVMEALINAPVAYDIEMIDNWLFCYTQSSQNLNDPQTWRLFETITNGLVGSMMRVAGRYRDRHVEQAASPWAPQTAAQIAPQGMRLRKGFSKQTLVSLVSTAGIFLFYMFMRHFISGR